jgi:hypothetical protein
MYCNSNTWLRFFANRIPHNIELLISYYTGKNWGPKKEISQAATTIPAQEKQLFNGVRTADDEMLAHKGIIYAWHTACRETAVCRHSHLGMKGAAWVIHLEDQSISKLEYGSRPTWIGLAIYIKKLHQKRKIAVASEEWWHEACKMMRVTNCNHRIRHTKEW